MGFASSICPNSCPFLDATVKFHSQTTLNCSPGPLLLLLLKENNSYKCSLAFSSQNKPELLKLFQYNVPASWLIWTEAEQRVITLDVWRAGLQAWWSRVMQCSWHRTSNNSSFSQHSWSRKGACIPYAGGRAEIRTFCNCVFFIFPVKSEGRPWFQRCIWTMVQSLSGWIMVKICFLNAWMSW